MSRIASSSTERLVERNRGEADRAGLQGLLIAWFATRHREFKGATEFLAGALSQFNAVKLAWRNRVMHIGQKYLRQETKDIFDATAAFMRHLAAELREEVEDA